MLWIPPDPGTMVSLSPLNPCTPSAQADLLDGPPVLTTVVSCPPPTPKLVLTIYTSLQHFYRLPSTVLGRAFVNSSMNLLLWSLELKGTNAVSACGSSFLIMS